MLLLSTSRGDNSSDAVRLGLKCFKAAVCWIKLFMVLLKGTTGGDGSGGVGDGDIFILAFSTWKRLCKSTASTSSIVLIFAASPHLFA